MYEVRYTTKEGKKVEKFEGTWKGREQAKWLARDMSITYGEAYMIDNKLDILYTWKYGQLVLTEELL